MRDRLHRSRRLAAWACLFAWMLMIVGPLHHSSGHQDDHIHVGGAVVPVPGAPSHTHADPGRSSPADLIADARAGWVDDDDTTPSEEPSDRDDRPIHGFDTLAHFGAAPLETPPPLVPILESTPDSVDMPIVDVWLPAAPRCGGTSIRGPPASSA